MLLSKNFSLLELTKSQTAERRGIENKPTAEHIENMVALCENILPVSYTHLTLPTSR